MCGPLVPPDDPPLRLLLIPDHLTLPPLKPPTIVKPFAVAQGGSIGVAVHFEELLWSHIIKEVILQWEETGCLGWAVACLLLLALLVSWEFVGHEIG